MYIEQLGNELKSIRIRKGLTLEEAQTLLGINKSVLSVYENNPGCLKISKFLDILSKYNEEPDIFFQRICEYIRKNGVKDNEEGG